MMRVVVITCLICFIVLSCTLDPEPIHYGKDQCTFCKMTIEDPKFGAELMTEKGRIYKYDAIECLLSDLKNHDKPGAILVTPFDRVGTLVAADSLSYLKAEEIKSPMGAGLAAFANVSSAKEIFENGEWMNWNRVKTSFRLK